VAVVAPVFIPLIVAAALAMTTEACEFVTGFGLAWLAWVGWLGLASWAIRGWFQGNSNYDSASDIG